MSVSPVRPSLAVQLTWTARLMSAAFRCRPRQIILIVSAFALATLSALACLAFAACFLDQRTTVLPPAMVETSLRPERFGVGRAVPLAWSPRRAEGVASVDRLRTTKDQRWVQARISERRAGACGLAMGSATGLLALGLAAAAMRSRRAEARFLAGLGFTIGAIATPAAIVGAISALLGSLLGVLLGMAAVALVAQWWPGGFALAQTNGGFWGLTELMVSAAVIAGFVLGWWGARPSSRDREELASAE